MPWFAIGLVLIIVALVMIVATAPGRRRWLILSGAIYFAGCAALAASV